MQIYGHRGASGLAPENTLDAFRAALELGVDGIELDVRATADGRPVIIHDQSLRRTAGVERNVDELTLAELQQLAPEVPTLSAVLELAGDAVHLDVEVKQPGVEQLILESLAAFADARWALSCFDWDVLAAFRALSADAELWLLMMIESESLYEAAERLGATAIAVNGPALSETVIARAHAAGLRVMAWTVNDVEVAERLRGWGLDALCTDFPERFARQSP